MTIAMPLMGGTGDRPRRSSAPPEVSHLMTNPEPGHAPGLVVLENRGRPFHGMA
jgi:hypothetical protein